MIMQLIDGNKGLRALLANQSIEVACLGGGPGAIALPQSILCPPIPLFR